MSAITLPSLTQLDQVTVDRFRLLFAALIEEYNPQLDLKKRGPVHDLVLHPRAVLSAAHEQRLQTMLKSGSLLEIVRNPALADDETVDRVLSNFRLTRQPGGTASGRVVVVLSTQTPVVVPQGSVFTVRELTFVTTATFAARTSEQNVLSPNDRLLTRVAGGWAFPVDVTARAAGVAGNVPYGSTAVPAQPPPRFSKAYAGADFSGGADRETNAQLLARLAAGRAAQGWSSRPGVEALLRAHPPLAALKAVSVVGFGDPEMRRDRHSVWPGALGGRCDVYLRADDLKTVVLTRQATLVDKAGTVGTWQIGLLRTDAPGFYEVKSVLPDGVAPDAGTLAVSLETRGLDLAGTNVPDVAVPLEGTYSRYQTAVVRFVDELTNVADLPVNTTTRPYTVALRVMPLLDEAQDYLGTARARPPAGDVLVRGPVPCFLSLTFTVSVRQGSQAPTAPVVQRAVAAYVNGLGFPGQLTASAVAQVVHNASPSVAGLIQMDMLGRIRRPDGTMVFVRSGDRLVVPDQPGDGVTARTVSFFLDPDDVAVTMTAADTPVV